MKTNRRRLSLSKETVRALNDHSLRAANGGLNKTDPAGPCSYSQGHDAETRCNDSGNYMGTDGCPSGVYSGCETIC